MEASEFEKLLEEPYLEALRVFVARKDLGNWLDFLLHLRAQRTRRPPTTPL